MPGGTWETVVPGYMNMTVNTMQLGKYRHYKGKEYDVLGVAHHSETLEELVVYRARYESEDFGKNALWVRPKRMFLEEVEIDGKRMPRFTPIETL